MSISAEMYTALSASSPRSEVTAMLQSIISAPPLGRQAVLRALVQAILADIKDHESTSGRLTTADVGLALLAIKTMGHSPTASTLIASDQNLSLLLGLATTLKDVEACNAALRCVANAMLLVESARLSWLEPSVDGGPLVLDILERANSPDRIFLACRILFLGTVTKEGAAGTFLQDVVERKRSSGTGLDVVASKLEFLIDPILAGAKMSREAATDILKFTFNILVHYPKISDSESLDPSSSKSKESAVMGDFWSPKLQPLLPSLLRVFKLLPINPKAPLAAPMTHIIHSLISIPVNADMRSIWFGKGSPTPSPPRTDSPVSGSSSQRPGALDRALSSVIAAGRSLSNSRSGSPISIRPVESDAFIRARELFDAVLAHYLPGKVDPDDESVRDRCDAEGNNTLDDLVTPLVLLLNRMAAADEGIKLSVRDWIVPPDLDRTTALETRSDTLGRCLRLLPCIYHPRLKDAIGELLFTVSDSDASTLSALVGYGNVAGFLVNKGVMSAPAAPSSSSGVSLTTPSGASINPITGTVQQDRPLSSDMTDEEKEREAEKLFVLFDRLEKTGAMPASQNPIRKMAEKGMLG